MPNECPSFKNREKKSMHVTMKFQNTLTKGKITNTSKCKKEYIQRI